MLVTELTKRSLEWHREKRHLFAQGYRIHETDWEIHRGNRTDEIIVDAIISCDGKYVYTRLGKPSKPSSPDSA